MEQFDFSEMENSKNRNVGENVPIFRSHAENWGNAYVQRLLLFKYLQIQNHIFSQMRKSKNFKKIQSNLP